MLSKFLALDGAAHPIRPPEGDRDPGPAPPARRAPTTHPTAADERDRPCADRCLRSASAHASPPRAARHAGHDPALAPITLTCRTNRTDRVSRGPRRPERFAYAWGRARKWPTWARSRARVVAERHARARGAGVRSPWRWRPDDRRPCETAAELSVSAARASGSSSWRFRGRVAGGPMARL